MAERKVGKNMKLFKEMNYYSTYNTGRQLTIKAWQRPAYCTAGMVVF